MCNFVQLEKQFVRCLNETFTFRDMVPWLKQVSALIREMEMVKCRAVISTQSTWLACRSVLTCN